LANTRVTIEPDNQHVTQLASQFEAAKMAGMKQVKAAVGEDDAAPIAFVAAKPQNRFF
jgi:hypothetical protein